MHGFADFGAWVDAQDAVRLLQRRTMLHATKLRHQKVCVVKPSFVSCSVAEGLAGAKVKVKCRAAGTTLLKSPACRVPAGRGGDGGHTCLPVPLPAASCEAVYEGYEALSFELCESRLWRSSAVLATGELSIAQVFRKAGLAGSTASWTVPLSSKGGEACAWLTVAIHCEATRLNLCGGIAALRKLAPPRQPEVLYPIGGAGSVPPGAEAEEFCDGCAKATVQLKEAFEFACDAAGESRRLRASESAPLLG